MRCKIGNILWIGHSKEVGFYWFDATFHGSVDNYQNVPILGVLFLNFSNRDFGQKPCTVPNLNILMSLYLLFKVIISQKKNIH